MNTRAFLAGLAAVPLFAAASVAAAAASPVSFPSLDQLPASLREGDRVEVNIGKPLIALAARLAEKEEPEAAALLADLHAITVRVFHTDASNRGEVLARMNAVRADLEKAGWDRAVFVQEDGEDVAVYVAHDGETVSGLMATVLSADGEAVFAHIDGRLDPDKLGAIGERFGIDDLAQASFPRPEAE